MKLLWRVSGGVLAALVVCSLIALQARGFQYLGDARTYQYDTGASNEKAEFYWSRLQYNSRYGGGGGGFGGYGFGGGWGRAWSRDYPKADRQFLLAMKRLTNVNTRSTEQVVDIDAKDDAANSLDNYPWVYAVQAQTWTFTDDEAKRMHDYLMKGGFLMVDDFHGTGDWELFMQGLRQFLPNAQVEDLNDNDEIFHVLFDLSNRFQIPGEQYVMTGRTYEKDGYVAKWRAVRDEKGRIIVAICYNMHLGDAWEWADDPRYPERFASLAFRVGLNYIVYGMTH